MRRSRRHHRPPTAPRRPSENCLCTTTRVKILSMGERCAYQPLLCGLVNRTEPPRRLPAASSVNHSLVWKRYVRCRLRPVWRSYRHARLSQPLYGLITSQRQRSSTPVPSLCPGSPCRSATWWQRCSAPPEPRRCSISVGNQTLKSNGSSVAGQEPSPRRGRIVLASKPMPIWTPSCRHLLKTICRRNAPIPERLAVYHTRGRT